MNILEIVDNSICRQFATIHPLATAIHPIHMQKSLTPTEDPESYPIMGSGSKSNIL